jgi:hypothetical protein
MQTRTKILSWVVMSGILAVSGVWIYAPVYIKQQIEQKVPGAIVGDVKLRPWHIEITHTFIERPGLWADLPFIRVYSDGRVFVDGGNVDIAKPTDPAATTQPIEKAASTREIHFQALHITTDWHGTPVDLENVSGILGQDVTAERATTSHPKFGTITAKVVRYDPNHASGTFRAETVSVHGFEALPTDPCDHVEMEGVEVTPGLKCVGVRTATCGSNRIDDLQVQWSASNIILRAGTAVVSHPALHPVPLVITRPVILDWDGAIAAIEMGKVALAVNPERKHLDIKGKCADFAFDMPDGLAEALKDIEFKGDLDIHILWDPQNPDVTVKGRCTAACSSPRLRALRRPFKYSPYASDWTRKERQSGPGTRDWVPLPMVATAMPTAAIALEDPGFLHHRGWITGAFRNSLKMNLEKGRFAHGGSTITMQLAKNLWLTRDKTFGRKAQELLLASALESCFNKDEILELYLNVIEFGPDLYGIGPASVKWFHTSPSELTPRQAFWLASILPKPRKAVQPDETVLARTEQFVKKLVDAGRVPETMLETVPEGALEGW